MKITSASEAKIVNVCKALKSKRERAVRDPALGGPGASSVINCFRRLEDEFEDGIIRLEKSNDQPVLLDLEFTAGGNGMNIWPVMMIGNSDRGLLLKAWFDNDGHAQILANYGTYSNEIKFASASDLSDWVIEYLRLQN